MADVVTREIAESEVNAWLAFKKVPDAYVKGSAVFINGIIIAVQEGSIIIDQDTFEITHKLKWPIGKGDFAISELKYKPRLSVATIQSNIAGLGIQDFTGKTMGIGAALCGRPRTEIAGMDSEDYRVLSDIAAFFST